MYENSPQNAFTRAPVDPIIPMLGSHGVTGHGPGALQTIHPQAAQQATPARDS